MNNYDYTGKTIYVGIDVHKKTYSCVSICDGQIIKRDRMPGKPDVLYNYLTSCFSGGEINTVYEAGFTGFHLHRILVDQGIKNKVVHAGSIEVASRDRVKTDKRDALKMATQLSANRLKGIHVPSIEREAKRSITRLRANTLSLRHRVGLQFKALLFTQGLISCDDDNKLTKAWLNKKLSEIKVAGFPEDLCFTLEESANQWIELTNRIKSITARLKQQAIKDIALQTIYESVPGIGFLSARELANELGDMTQFKNERAIFSYTGLTPSENSSGEHVRHGHITRQGKAKLRKILVEAAWIAIKRDPNLAEKYSDLAKRRGGKRAIVAIARKLIGRIRACVLTGTLYEIKSTQENCKECDVTS